jgi:serine/threonine protein kinase
VSSGPDERLLRLAEDLTNGRRVDWDQVRGAHADLQSKVESLRQLESISIACRASFRGLKARPGAARARMQPPRPVLFRWGGIEVLDKLGEGGLAEVYRAWDPKLGREVALKLSRAGPGGRTGRVDRLLDEARRLARVRHPNVLVVHGADVRRGRAGFWTELIHGRTLEAVLQEQGRLGGGEAVMIGLDLCRALAAVHTAGLVHGDLKASNVMREGFHNGGSGAAPGRIVLMDFGASSECVPPAGQSATFLTPLTSAPEVMQGEPPSPSSDLYSLGMLLFRLVAGRYPMEPRDLADLEAKIRVGARTPLRDIRPDLGTTLMRTVEHAVEPDPARRFHGVVEMEQALDAALAEEGAPRFGPTRRY